MNVKSSGLPNNGTSRRELLGLGVLAGVGIGASLTGCSSVHKGMEAARGGLSGVLGPTPARFQPLPGDAAAVSKAVHALNRVGFGPRPGDVARVVAQSPHGYIEEQLADRMDDDPAVAWRVNGLEVIETEQDAPDVLASMSDTQLLVETQQAALLRAVYSRHQLREALADFWTNHFNIYALKNDGRILMPTDTEHVIRPHVLGRFRDMLLGSARSPAMLSYLDNQQNQRGVANENYAREILELHTLGVNSGYSQQDIQAVARCFTGWTVTTGFRRGQFRYESERHDDGSKFIPFLNLTIAPNGGQRDAETVLEALAVHPATARFLVRKLCRHFLGDAPPAVVEQGTRAYLQSGGDIRATLRPILLDALFDPTSNQPIVKRPLDLTVSALRCLAADTDGGINLQTHLGSMGQPLYQWPMPDGFPEKASAWTGSLLSRWNFAFALASNGIEGTTVDLNAPFAGKESHSDTEQVDTLLRTVLCREADSPELHEVRTHLQDHIRTARAAGTRGPMVLAEVTGLALASPPFQIR